MFNIYIFPPPEKRAVYGIMWKYIVQLGRSKITIWRTRIACWIPKATNIHLLLFHCNNGLKNAPHITLHVHCLSCF